MTKERPLDKILRYTSSDVRSYSGTELEALTSRQSLRTAVARGALVRLFSGIYVAREHQDSFYARTHAALAWAGTDAALASESALFLWGGLAEVPELVHVVVPHGTGLRPPPWLRLTRTLYPFQTASWRENRVVTAEYALVKAFGALPAARRVDAVYRCVTRGIVNAAILNETLHATPRVRFRPQLRAVVNAALRGAESYLEQ